MPYPTTNVTTDISNGHICILSSETCAWKAVITGVRYNCSSVHKSGCDTAVVDRFR